MKIITITQSKKWWNNKLKTILETYRWTGEYSDWFSFFFTTRLAKCHFLDKKIAEIASDNKQS